MVHGQRQDVFHLGMILDRQLLLLILLALDLRVELGQMGLVGRRLRLRVRLRVRLRLRLQLRVRLRVQRLRRGVRVGVRVGVRAGRRLDEGGL